jgi:hypothetical protein
MRWLRRRWNLFRLVFLLLVLTYGVLFFQIHKLEVNSVVEPPTLWQTYSKEQQKTIRRPFPFPPKKKEVQTTNQSALPAPSDWNHGILDGKAGDYLGSNLWEHTALPDWMKRKTCSGFNLYFILFCCTFAIMKILSFSLQATLFGTRNDANFWSRIPTSGNHSNIIW